MSADLGPAEQARPASESPRERNTRLVAEGRVPGSALAEAEALWQERLRGGVQLPNGDVVRVTRDDLYHVLVDDRIWRHPERIELALTHVFEIRQARGGRRLAFSQWMEEDQDCLAAIVLQADRLWSMHLVDRRRIQRYIRRGGDMIWKRSAP
jgi:hypothetical protein